MIRFIIALMCSCLFVAGAGAADSSTWTVASPDQVNAVLPEAEALYRALHQNPEISLHEEQTAAKLAMRIRALGYDVTTNVGGYGIVGVLKNGAGPTVMLRTELDALPMPEKTGVPYASIVTMKNDAGTVVPVMHACGHDLHMATLYGTAKIMAANRDKWHGTLIVIGQPAEEIGAGAAAMLKDGLYTRFPKPDYAFALHDDAGMLVGNIGYLEGYHLASADSVDITIYGRGSHGAEPQKGVDPILIASRTVVALQSIISREVTPGDPAVVTVGSIHGGTQNNIIPEEVKLQLTVRTYNPETRKKLLAGIERITRGEAAAGGAPKEPLIITKSVSSAAYNDPELTRLIVAKLATILGPDKLILSTPHMAFDDFAEFGVAGARSVHLNLGAVAPAKYAAAQQPGAAPLPGVHSPYWAPDYSAALKTGITVETAALLELLARK